MADLTKLFNFYESKVVLRLVSAALEGVGFPSLDFLSDAPVGEDVEGLTSVPNTVADMAAFPLFSISSLAEAAGIAIVLDPSIFELLSNTHFSGLAFFFLLLLDLVVLLVAVTDIVFFRFFEIGKPGLALRAFGARDSIISLNLDALSLLLLDRNG